MRAHDPPITEEVDEARSEPKFESRKGAERYVILRTFIWKTKQTNYCSISTDITTNLSE